mgnify:CR=1 FL=1
MSLTKYYVFQGIRQGAKNRRQRKALNKATQINFFQKRIDRNVTILSRLDQAKNPVLFKKLTDSVDKDNDTLEALIKIPKLTPTTEGDKVDKTDSSKTVIADVGKKKVDVDEAVGTGAVGFLNRGLQKIGADKIPDPVELFGLDDEARDITKAIIQKTKSEVTHLGKILKHFFKILKKEPKMLFNLVLKLLMIYLMSVKKYFLTDQQ